MTCELDIYNSNNKISTSTIKKEPNDDNKIFNDKVFSNNRRLTSNVLIDLNEKNILSNNKQENLTNTSGRVQNKKLLSRKFQISSLSLKKNSKQITANSKKSNKTENSSNSESLKPIMSRISSNLYNEDYSISFSNDQNESHEFDTTKTLKNSQTNNDQHPRGVISVVKIITTNSIEEPKIKTTTKLRNTKTLKRNKSIDSIDNELVKCEKEIHHLNNENSYLKHLITKLKESIKKLEESKVDNEFNENKCFQLNKQIYILQEELIRVKMLLDQSQQMRKSDIERNQVLQNRLDLLEKISVSDPKLSLYQHFELINQITRLQASESILRQSLENEKSKINELNDQLFELNRRIHHYSNNSLEERLENFNDSSNENIYYEILENLKSHGFSKETSNYQDIVVYLYKQKMNALNQLNDFSFYMKQINPENIQNPLDAIKKLYIEMKAYQHEINQLKQKVELNKLEMKLQQEEYRRQISSLNDELNNKWPKIENKMTNYLMKERIEDSAIEEDTLSQNIPIYTSTAEFVTSRVITIPTLDTSAFYAVDTENVDDIASNRYKTENKSVEMFDQETEIDGELLKNLNKDKELRLKCENLVEQLDKLRNEKANVEQKLISILTELKQIQNENFGLATKYETQIQLLNEQINNFQEESIKLKNENNQLRLIQTKNNNELTQLIENYEDEIKNANHQINKVKADMDILRLENDKLQQRCEELHETINKNLNESIKRSAEHNNEISTFSLELSKSKMECENYKNENEKLLNEIYLIKQDNTSANEDLKRKLISYENEISLLNKEIKKLEIELNNSHLDYKLKCDEINRLQKTLIELDQLKDKYTDTEHKLSMQIKTSQNVQEKLHQLQNDLISKGLTYETNLIHNSNDSNYETIIDNLKFIINEHLNLRNSNAQNEIDELKYKIHDLQMKLNHEKLQTESLEMKFKLVDQDNQNLRKTLLSNSRKHANSDRMAKSHMEEVNDLIERAQKNAQSILASNPAINNVYDISLNRKN